ncbi:MAG: hypothetical protein M3044_21685 [Thermoproteota archaeon]|nr:hypothetical protein [Thermoproteota archaeon]
MSITSKISKTTLIKPIIITPVLLAYGVRTRVWGVALSQMKTALFLLVPVLVLVLAPLTVIMPQAYATGPYDDGYKTAKFDFLHNKSYNDACYTDCTLYKLGYSEAWNTLNGWLGNR